MAWNNYKHDDTDYLSPRMKRPAAINDGYEYDKDETLKLPANERPTPRITVNGAVDEINRHIHAARIRGLMWGWLFGMFSMLAILIAAFFIGSR